MQGISAAKQPDGRTTISDFESGLDGWSTNGGNERRRISRDDAPQAVVGTHAMAVTVNGDRYPMVERVIDGVDLTAHPYLFADVAPGQVSDTTSDLTFRFRIRYARGTPTSNGRGKGRDSDRDPNRPVLESEPMTARALERTTLRWDLSSVDDGALAGAKRLQVLWYPTEFPPEDLDQPHGRQTVRSNGNGKGDTGGNGNGRGNGQDDAGGSDFAYHGEVILDDVYATANRQAFESAALDAKWRTLQAEHGRYQETQSIVRSEHREEGEYVFDDGTAVPYVVEVVDDGRIRYVLDSVESTVEVPR